MSLRLTNSAQQTVDRLRKHRETLMQNGFTAHNAADRVRFDNGNVNAELVSFALGMSVNPSELKRWGFLAE